MLAVCCASDLPGALSSAAVVRNHASKLCAVQTCQHSLTACTQALHNLLITKHMQALADGRLLCGKANGAVSLASGLTGCLGTCRNESTSQHAAQTIVRQQTGGSAYTAMKGQFDCIRHCEIQPRILPTCCNTVLRQIESQSSAQFIQSSGCEPHFEALDHGKHLQSFLQWALKTDAHASLT